MLAIAMAVGAAGQPSGTTCAIDMGSNTFRRIVGSFQHGRYEQRPIEKRPLGVGDDLGRHGRISAQKLDEIAAVLSQFKSSCEQEGAARVVAVGTAAFRDAPNGRRAVEIAAKLGIPMEIASERRESELAYLVGSLGQDGYAVIDNGSRSIELVAREAGDTRALVFNLGYRLAFETFFAPARDARAAIAAFRDRLRRHAAEAPFMRGKKQLVGVEFGEMAEILFEPAPLEGRVLSLEMLKRKLDEISGLASSDFEALKKTKDIDHALPRLVAAAVLAEAFGYARIELTERELGAGLIIEAGLKER